MIKFLFLFSPWLFIFNAFYKKKKKENGKITVF